MLALSDQWKTVTASRRNTVVPNRTWSWMTIIMGPDQEAIFIGHAAESDRYFIGEFPSSFDNYEFEAESLTLEVAWLEFLLRRGQVRNLETV